MATIETCPKCGCEAANQVIQGLCPMCLLGVGLEASGEQGLQGVTIDSVAPSAKHAAFEAPVLKSSLRYFGNYELQEEIARGGMGVVYLARQVSLNRMVALKMILSGEFAGPADVERFYSEAESAAQLDHPGIVPIYEIGEHEGHHFYSMGLVQGDSLAANTAIGPLPSKTAAELTQKVALAIQYAHDHGVIHRDLKPANILLDKDGQPRVTDFGLAKRVRGDSELTRTGQVLGTPSYMPPEQASGKLAEIGPAADIYALGAILYTLLTGRPPFQAASSMETLLQVLEQAPVRPRLLNARLPRDLETITLKCLEKSKQSRYGTAQELADDLGRYLRDEPIKARRTSTTVRALRWVRRNRAKSLAITAAAALLFSVMAILLMWNVDQSQWNIKAVGYSVTSHQGQLAILCDDLKLVFQGVGIPNSAPASGSWRLDHVHFTGATLSIDVSEKGVRASPEQKGIPGVVTIKVRHHTDETNTKDYTLYLSNNGESWATQLASGEVQYYPMPIAPPGRLSSVTISPDGSFGLSVYVK